MVQCKCLTSFVFLLSLSCPVVSLPVVSPPSEKIRNVSFNYSRNEYLRWEEQAAHLLNYSYSKIEKKNTTTDSSGSYYNITEESNNADVEFVAQGGRGPRWTIGSGVYLHKEVDYGDCSDDDWSDWGRGGWGRRGGRGRGGWGRGGWGRGGWSDDWSDDWSDWSDSDWDGRKFWFLKVRDNDQSSGDIASTANEEPVSESLGNKSNEVMVGNNTKQK
ncbi:uncharacterized protein SPAPADRAFT_66465 [Spathaspora passalidarum NRRL Y-27907]|uniref:Uncharacterized protein n=1 Tax=Spathaspora passalidarum (strain NRRL Y-27907 / 11-Y1) TaxID=619300 RepID=G3AMR4_SPAPN|nr:uncharacterized protein SPAPADRAFT_66465 [Spathaspora passalidarum NRRL Y-27907]EGW33508.1 hypothetical protein SPAPADRAFT_66465 [Spathaspora passalidarum NRRL Y-27907]